MLPCSTESGRRLLVGWCAADPDAVTRPREPTTHPGGGVSRAVGQPTTRKRGFASLGFVSAPLTRTAHAAHHVVGPPAVGGLDPPSTCPWPPGGCLLSAPLPFLSPDDSVRLSRGVGCAANLISTQTAAAACDGHCHVGPTMCRRMRGCVDCA
jgi:hypothetical protein